MRLNREYQLDKVVSDDETRPQICNVWVNVDGERAIATNGKSLAIVPITKEEGDTSGLVSVDALKLARKQKTDSIGLNGALSVKGITLPRPNPEDVGVFPNFDMIMDSMKKEPIFKITLNAELLHDLAKALGASKYEGITLSFYGAENAVKVEGKAGAVGAIMPIRMVK